MIGLTRIVLSFPTRCYVPVRLDLPDRPRSRTAERAGAGAGGILWRERQRVAPVLQGRAENAGVCGANRQERCDLGHARSGRRPQARAPASSVRADLYGQPSAVDGSSSQESWWSSRKCDIPLYFFINDLLYSISAADPFTPP